MHDPTALIQGIQISGDDGILSVEFMVASGALVKAVLAFSKGVLSSAVSDGRSGKEIYQEFMSSKGVTKAKWNRISVGAISSPAREESSPVSISPDSRHWHLWARRLVRKGEELAGSDVKVALIDLLAVCKDDETNERFLRKSVALLSKYIGTDASLQLIKKVSI
ncbi:hypothetical protein [Rhodoferax mekongensis]|uniref:hypothetical protein n=1 Tax=Rhodoferax mekongensis TaxID=3068341 RepID=UPI0028BE3E91|nr:hypothetical protein [Rhodoferax sp. TBRC 17199]MDT7515385.1 hypothetical protein [Rhodoferax sp. TBRC 17199]